MSMLTRLGGLALGGAGKAAAYVTGVGAVGVGVDVVGGFLRKQFADGSKKLPRAVERAVGRAWRAVEVALAGKSWWDRCKLTLATGEDRAIRAQVQAYLDANPLDGVDGHGPDFRAQCVAQLQAARKSGLLDRGTIDPDAATRQAGDLSRFGDPSALIEAEYALLVELADGLRRQGYDALATFLCLRPAGGPPLLSSAVHYFFQREIESDPELSQAWGHARVEKLASDQQSGFAELASAMDAGLERLEDLLADVQAVVQQTHDDVLDIKAELARQGRQMGELGQAVLQALSRQHLDRRELHMGDSLSIRDEGERRLVRDLVKRYRNMPAEQRHEMPALLNAVGKLQVMAGDFDAAEKDFREVAAMVGDGPAKAEAAYNAYRAALERRAYADALASLREAVALDPARFAPFPAEKYEAEKILGAGGFGVAILCRNRHSGGKVVIKTLRRDGLDRELGEVFREAQALEELEHPAIIRIRDCDYADAAKTRPFFVMDFFAGQTLADHVDQYGTLEPAQAVALARLIASGLERAHTRGILHRDVKPGNILVRPAGDGWEAKLIDFGLALRPAEASSTAKSSLDRTLAGASIAGTLEYAAPEQMGKLPGVAVGPYSDVFGFGKTCCFALFGTPQPTFQHWKTLPTHLAELLGRCLDEKPRARPRDFAEVIRELDRRVPEPKPARVPILEAMPVEEAPARPVPRPAPRPAPRREPEPDPRPRADRERRGRDRDEPRKKGSGGAAVALVMCTMLVAVGGGIFYFLTPRTPRPFTAFPTARPVEVNPIGIPFFPQAPAPAPVLEFKPEEVPAVLEELKKKPDLPRLRTIADRLAKTTPSADQTKKHMDYERSRSLAKEKAGPSEAELARLAKEDDILQVSLALQPLLDPSVAVDHQTGATACQKWGTEANADALLRLAKSTGVWERGIRSAACRALGAIGDPRGIPPSVDMVKDPFSIPPHSSGEEVMVAFVAFGPSAESAVWPLLTDGRALTKRFAVQILGKIGTDKSLVPLEAVSGDHFIKKEVAAALAAIRSRTPKGDR